MLCTPFVESWHQNNKIIRNQKGKIKQKQRGLLNFDQKISGKQTFGVHSFLNKYKQKRKQRFGFVNSF